MTQLLRDLQASAQKDAYEFGKDDYDGCMLVGGGEASDRSELKLEYNGEIDDELEAELLNGYCSDEAGDRSYSK